MNDQRRKFLPSFARTRSRGLKEMQKRYLIEVLPRFELTDKTDLAAFAKTYDAIYFEIGFGSGEHLIHRAAENPSELFIGAEVYDEGMAKAVKKIDDLALNNVLLTQEDARLMLEHIPNNMLDGLYILFPDPWPKAKHHKRRIVSKPLLDIAARVIKQGGFVQIATDHPDYLAWSSAQMLRHRAFYFTANCEADWLTPPKGHFTTRYQTKNKSGSEQSFFLRYKKYNITSDTKKTQ